MLLKLKPVVLCVSLLSLFCFGLNFVGVANSVSAQGTQAPKKEETTSVGKSKTPACKGTPECESKPVCCKQQQTCGHEKDCTSKPKCSAHSHACQHERRCEHKPGCDTPCKKKSGCKAGDGHCVDDLLKIVNCAKKQLLKEKMKANLEKKIGAKLDKVADLLVDTMLEEYKAGSECKERRDALKKKLSEIFSEKTSP
ncbi:MAG: hypothetical protein D8M57_04785 [Candidatus Scalindua sp. AMX11]|nr:MAG: hypothetical protein DWQ00_03810 [Candidatus Scalindua sp.]NOG84570.1 hypothetical protein [Planctomycetota bacterium]RZV92345.1 MAG: hypothetical protein EX341_04665 [Candidatus Scalindua sp. SCAELEC01]TDE66130.1 MAG: hypothetical protein D8M57_04785 [Candidatus Scalindua sp. AMX11]GJQ59104.1 MAG: hypothetical protein SCALA701_19050 [Candidatus Scalindua sp.]